MKQIKKLLSNHNGESMTELIVAFALFMLILASLTSMVTLGLKFNRMAADADKAYYSEFVTDDEKLLTVSIVNVSPDGIDAPTDLQRVQYYRNAAGIIYFEFDGSSTSGSSDGGTGT